MLTLILRALLSAQVFFVGEGGGGGGGGGLVFGVGLVVLVRLVDVHGLGSLGLGLILGFGAHGGF